MANDYWDPGRLSVDRQPPDVEEFGFDTSERRDDDWADAEPGLDPAEWLADVETGATDSVDRLVATGSPERIEADVPGFPTLPRAGLVTVTAALGVAAILIAVLRRRGRSRGRRAP
jgi:hypothetical protein